MHFYSQSLCNQTHQLKAWFVAGEGEERWPERLDSRPAVKKRVKALESWHWMPEWKNKTGIPRRNDFIFSICCPQVQRGLWVATDLMSLTCDICRADWKWLEASVCLCRCSCVYRARQAESGLCQQPASQPGHCLLLLIGRVFISMHDGQCAWMCVFR